MRGGREYGSGMGDGGGGCGRDARNTWTCFDARIMIQGRLCLGGGRWIPDLQKKVLC